MPLQSKSPGDNRAAVAAAFGVSMKTLRHYEDLGMISPPRSEAGWRIYGAREFDRLHVILSLKQLGLPLAKIACVLDGGAVDLKALLGVQEDVLTERLAETEHALNVLRTAKTRLARGERLAAEDLAALIRKISPVMLKKTPEITALMRRFFTQEQLSEMQRAATDEDHAETTEGWAEIFAELDRAGDACDPLSPKGLDIARRAVSLIRVYTRGDVRLWNGYAKFLKAGMADEKVAEQFRMKKNHWEFLNKAMTELKRRGELKP